MADQHIPDQERPSNEQARRELDRSWQAINARGDKVENELDRETRRLQRDYGSDAPKNRD